MSRWHAELKPYFFEIQSKLGEIITNEITKIALTQSGEKMKRSFNIESNDSLADYSANLKALKKDLNVSLQHFPANGFKIIKTALSLLDPEHPFFQGDFSINLIYKKYNAFRDSIAQIMTTPTLKKFNFFALDQGVARAIDTYFRKYISSKEEYMKNIVRSLENATDIKESALSAYLLYEATMEFVRRHSKERKALIVSTFFEEPPVSQQDLDQKYDAILTNHQRITAPLYPITTPIVTPPLPDKKDFSISTMKKFCMDELINCNHIFAKKILDNNQLTEADFESARKIKKLRTILSGLNPKMEKDRIQIVVIMQYILKKSLSTNPENILFKCRIPEFVIEMSSIDDAAASRNILRTRFKTFFNKTATTADFIKLEEQLMPSESKKTPRKPNLFSSDENDNSPPQSSINTRPSTPTQ